MKYRIYIDEVGNSDLESSDDPNHRFLSLTGVILELGYEKGRCPVLPKKWSGFSKTSTTDAAKESSARSSYHDTKKALAGPMAFAIHLR